MIQITRPPAWLVISALICATLTVRAELAIVGSTSFAQPGGPGRLANLSRPTPLGDGGTAFLAELFDEGNRQALIVDRGGRLTTFRAEAFGATGVSPSSSPFLGLTADGEKVVVIVRTAPANALRIFSLDAANVITPLADATAFINGVGGFALLREVAARAGSVAVQAMNLNTRPGIPAMPAPNRIGIFRDNALTSVAGTNGPEGFTGFAQLEFAPDGALHFLGSIGNATSLYRWQDGTLVRLIAAGTMVEDGPINLASYRIRGDGAVGLHDAAGGRVVAWQAGRFVVLARDDTAAADVTTVRIASLLRVDDAHVYFSGLRSVTLTSGVVVDRADLVFRVPREGGRVELVFDAGKAFPDSARTTLADLAVSGSAPDLTLLIRENTGSQQAVLRGPAPFSATPFPAVPPGYPQLRLEDRGNGFSYRAAIPLRLSVETSSPGAVTTRGPSGARRFRRRAIATPARRPPASRYFLSHRNITAGSTRSPPPMRLAPATRPA